MTHSRFFTWMLFLLLTVGICSCTGKEGKAGKGGEKVPSAEIGTLTPDSVARLEVYYFRFSRSCTTCEAVSAVTEAYLKERYPDLMKNGSITFTVVNLEKKEGRVLAERMGVDGQTLLLCGKNGKRIDLTANGFRYAASRPETFKDALRQNIEALL